MNNLDITTLFVSAIIVDTIIGYYLLISNRGGKYIKEWYKTLNIGAFTLDILSIVFGTYFAVLLTNNIYKQIIYTIIIGLIHDLSFGYFLKNTNYNSSILKLFKNYANELGITIVIVDALMLVSTILIGYLLKNNLNSNIIKLIGIITAYMGLLMVYSF